MNGDGWTTVVAQPSQVEMTVRVEWPDYTTPHLEPWWLNAVAEAVDSFVYELCEVCGQDLGGHVVVPGPLGHPHLWCENGEG